MSGSFITIYRRPINTNSEKSELLNDVSCTKNQNNSTVCPEVNEITKTCDKQPAAQSVSENEKTSSNLGSGFTDLESDINCLDTVSSKQNTDATSISESTILDSEETAPFSIDKSKV